MTGVQLPHSTSSNGSSNLDDDGQEKRTGTWLTASAHIITAVIGSGVLSLSWAVAQLGWITGPIMLFLFAIITFVTSAMLCDCYRSPDPVTGKRNYTYTDAVKSYLGERKVKFCGLAQYTILVGVCVGYTITSSISMVAIAKSNCFHNHGHDAHCEASKSNYVFMAFFAVIQILLCQIPNFHKLSWLSLLAAVMSFAYALIGISLSIAKVAGAHGITADIPVKTTLTGTVVGVDVTGTQKIFQSMSALGNIAFAYSFAVVIIEIQNTLKSSPPENKAMKRASVIGISVTTIFYMMCGCIGYAAFGNNAPGNFLTGFGFYEPFWLVDIGNFCVALHLIGAYQVFCQPIHALVEEKCHKRWPESKFMTREYPIKFPFLGTFRLNSLRLVWRTSFVIVTALVAMTFPFFNDFLGLIGAISFWPLTVYFPIEMHLVQSQVPKYCSRWIWLNVISAVCLIVSLVAAVGSVQGLITSVRAYHPFQNLS